MTVTIMKKAKPLTYANVAPPAPSPPPPPPPPPRDHNRKRSICASCNCPNCHDTESCTGSVINGGYLRTVADKPPIPCRQRKFTDDFSPEDYFNEKEKVCNEPKPDTGRLRELDIPLPLPTTKSTDSVPHTRPSSDLLHSIHEQFIHRHPSPQPPVHSQKRPLSLHRKPSDELPYPDVVNQPFIHQQPIELQTLKQKKYDPLTQYEVTLPRRKSELRKRIRRQPPKVSLWLRLGTILGLILLIGLSYMVYKTANDMFFVHNRHPRLPIYSWNYSQPEESKLDTTVCFSCDLVDEFMTRHLRQQSRDLNIYGFKSSGRTRHCCMDQQGHTKWMVNMMKTREIMGRQEVKDPESNGVCSAKSTHVPVYSKCSQGQSMLKLDKTKTNKICQGAGINVTNDYLMAEEEGLYIVYMTLTVTMDPNKDCGERVETKVLKAHLHCDKSAKKRCIEMETFNVTKTYTDAYIQHAFNLYTLKNFKQGEKFFPSLSHPSHLYSAKYSNYIGVVQLKFVEL